MIEKLFKKIKFIGLGFGILDVAYIIVTALYFSLTLTYIIPGGIWFLIVSIIVLSLNLSFAIFCLVIKQLKKY